MRRAISVFVAVATMFAFAVPAMAQEAQAGCGWYWDYRFSETGGWEYWCWDPQWGWWYGESEDGKKKVFAPTIRTVV